MDALITKQELENKLAKIEYDLFAITSGRTVASKKDYATLYREKLAVTKELCRGFYLYDASVTDLSDEDYNLLYNNLRAFCMNFGKIRLRTVESGIEIYVNGNMNTYEDFAYNVDYLNGWLYGCVKVNNKRIKPIAKE